MRFLGVAAVATLLAFGAALVGCPDPKAPKGPPPEYEDPPPPSWLNEGGAPETGGSETPASAEGGASSRSDKGGV